jgi:hypothetical protein
MFGFFRSIAGLLGFAITAGVTLFGYWQARQFTQNKLRFVDGVHRMTFPVMIGAIAALIAAPLTWLIPLIGTGTALLFGGGVAFGVASGAREIRKRIGAG